MDVIFQTRFSFFGTSGWQSATSQSETMLFDPERLNKRFDLFERIALAGLRDQTDQDFKLSILSSTNLPEKYKTRLQELCNDTLGAARVDINYCGPFKAGKLFRQIMCKKYPNDDIIAQVVLDDDDAVASEFVEVCKHEANLAARSNYDDSEAMFLTFPRGVSLGLENGMAAWLAPRNAHFTNLGLTLVAPPSFKRHPYLTSHRQIGNRFTSRVILTKRPFYVRAVHEGNDSDAKHSDMRYDSGQIEEIFQYFPFLQNHFPAAMQMNAA